MGKQKSFIIVGSTFLAVILILILIPVFTKGIKDSKCEFEANTYYVEYGTERSLAPTIYASDKVKDLALDIKVDDESIVEIKEGTFAKGSASLLYWTFTEKNDEDVDKPIINVSDVLYNEDDEISIIDGFWAVNGTKTTCKAKREYGADEIKHHATSKSFTKNCYILNGIQTKILYDEKVDPVRDEASGNWFINGKDTGVSYKGIQCTIKGLALGETTLTVSGKIHGQDVSASTKIIVSRPDPTGITNSYLNKRVVVKANAPYQLEYLVKTKDSALVEASQEVIVTKSSGNAIGINGSVVTPNKVGETKLKVKVSDKSFIFGMTESFNTYITVYAVDADQAQIDAINTVREKIHELGTPANTPEYKEKLEAIKTLLATIDEANYVAIENLEDYYIGSAFVAIEDITTIDTTAETKAKVAAAKVFVDKVKSQYRIKNISKYNIANAVVTIDAIGTVENTDACKQLVADARAAVDKVEKKDMDQIINLATLTEAEEAIKGFAK